ncbi:MAG: hypothetical protein LBQ44_10545, partial [Treponema sp.]|nr:hypothetical protein [Treponema sp.]
MAFGLDRKKPREADGPVPRGGKDPLGNKKSEGPLKLAAEQGPKEKKSAKSLDSFDPFTSFKSSDSPASLDSPDSLNALNPSNGESGPASGQAPGDLSFFGEERPDGSVTLLGGDENYGVPPTLGKEGRRSALRGSEKGENPTGKTEKFRREYPAVSLQLPVEDKKNRESRTGDRVRDRRRTVEVTDLRAGTGPEAAASLSLKALEETRNSGEMVVDLRPVSAKSGGSGSSENFPSEIPRGQESFETMLARELGGELSQDIVKQAAIVLRNGDSG